MEKISRNLFKASLYLPSPAPNGAARGNLAAAHITIFAVRNFRSQKVNPQQTPRLRRRVSASSTARRIASQTAHACNIATRWSHSAVLVKTTTHKIIASRQTCLSQSKATYFSLNEKSGKARKSDYISAFKRQLAREQAMIIGQNDKQPQPNQSFKPKMLRGAASCGSVYHNAPPLRISA